MHPLFAAYAEQILKEIQGIDNYSDKFVLISMQLRSFAAQLAAAFRNMTEAEKDVMLGRK